MRQLWKASATLFQCDEALSWHNLLHLQITWMCNDFIYVKWNKLISAYFRLSTPFCCYTAVSLLHSLLLPASFSEIHFILMRTNYSSMTSCVNWYYSFYFYYCCCCCSSTFYDFVRIICFKHSLRYMHTYLHTRTCTRKPKTIHAKWSSNNSPLYITAIVIIWFWCANVAFSHIFHQHTAFIPCITFILLLFLLLQHIFLISSGRVWVCVLIFWIKCGTVTVQKDIFTHLPWETEIFSFFYLMTRYGTCATAII